VADEPVAHGGSEHGGEVPVPDGASGEGADGGVDPPGADGGPLPEAGHLLSFGGDLADHLL